MKLPFTKKSNTGKILTLLSDFQKHYTYDIARFIYPDHRSDLFNLHARITELRKAGFDIPEADKDEIGRYYILKRPGEALMEALKEFLKDTPFEIHAPKQLQFFKLSRGY